MDFRAVAFHWFYASRRAAPRGLFRRGYSLQFLDFARIGVSRSMDMALLQASLRFAREWGECALNLAFPWPETEAKEPVRIEQPYCRQCGFPFPALEHYDAEFICSDCSDRTWHFKWARSG